MTQETLDEFNFMSKELDIEKERSLKEKTLEEIAEEYSEKYFNRDEISMRNSKVSYIAGAKLHAT
jgi:uncharacterized ferredoxin-like protein